MVASRCRRCSRARCDTRTRCWSGGRPASLVASGGIVYEPPSRRIRRLVEVSPEAISRARGRKPSGRAHRYARRGARREAVHCAQARPRAPSCISSTIRHAPHGRHLRALVFPTSRTHELPASPDSGTSLQARRRDWSVAIINFEDGTKATGSNDTTSAACAHRHRLYPNARSRQHTHTAVTAYAGPRGRGGDAYIRRGETGAAVNDPERTGARLPAAGGIVEPPRERPRCRRAAPPRRWVSRRLRPPPAGVAWAAARMIPLHERPRPRQTNTSLWTGRSAEGAHGPLMSLCDVTGALLRRYLAKVPSARATRPRSSIRRERSGEVGQRHAHLRQVPLGPVRQGPRALHRDTKGVSWNVCRRGVTAMPSRGVGSARQGTRDPDERTRPGLVGGAADIPTARP